jgi:hypothetical protein
MVSRRRGRAAIGGLVVCPALILSLAGCTGGSGRPSPAASPPATERGAVPGTPAARVCTRPEDKTAISRFFADWNHRDAAALGRLFTADGLLDMATKHQDTLHKHMWASVGGLGARRLIAAFAERQWRLGEMLSYRGGGTRTVARFADGTVQHMEETKFVYDCAGHVFAHVVIISAKAAAPA